MNYITCPKCNEENLGNTKYCIKYFERRNSEWTGPSVCINCATIV
jgi:hypothetical protein